MAKAKLNAVQTFEVEDERRDGPPPPLVPITGNWWYKHHPKCWFVGDDRVLPDLRRLKRIRGSDNVLPDGTMALARATSEQKGWTILDHDCDPDGGKYIKRARVRGGLAHIDAWTQLFGGSKRRRFDREGYYAFLGRLVDAEVLAPPAVWVLEEMAETAQSRIDRCVRKGITDPRMARRAEVHRTQLAVIQRTITELYTAPEPEPPKPKPTKPKTTRLSPKKAA